MPLDDLCGQCVEMGLAGIDLVDAPDWPTLRRYGFTPAMASGAASIPDGWSRKENHDKLEEQMRESIARAAAAKVSNVITFPGNHRGLPDVEGSHNCILGLRRIKAYTEEQVITVCAELLSSKVNHNDDQCNHMAWRVEVCKSVESPCVKLLYAIHHMQIMEGDAIRTIRANIQYIGRFHTAGNPGRNEMDDTQELQYRTIAEAVAGLNSPGYFAHELPPRKKP